MAENQNISTVWPFSVDTVSQIGKRRDGHDIMCSFLTAYRINFA